MKVIKYYIYIYSVDSRRNKSASAPSHGAENEVNSVETVRVHSERESLMKTQVNKI